MDGEQLESLALLALEYDVARTEMRRATEEMEKKKERIMALFRDAREHSAVAGLYLCEVRSALRETIPVKLARSILGEEQFKQLVQATTSISLYISRRF